MKTILLSSLFLLVFAGCSHTSGFRSAEAPGVLVVTEGSVRHLEGTPASITLVRDQSETWSTMVDTLLERAQTRGARYLAQLEISWYEIREDETLRCGAKIQPRMVLQGQSSRGQTFLANGVIKPASSPPNAEARKALENQPEKTGTLVRVPTALHPGGLGYVNDPAWTLAMEGAACSSTPDEATDRVVLVATAY